MATKKNKLQINNVFGITPTTNCVAAGLDFYIPNIPADISEKTQEMILDAFSKSFNYTIEDLQDMVARLVLEVSAVKGEEYVSQYMNILHLFLGVTYNRTIINYEEAIADFVDNVLMFDAKKTPGIMVDTATHVKFNSGIKVKLEPNTAGIFFNKSGRGSAGWDVRACVVDEDYAGFVHTSVAFTEPNFTKSVIYCGDKLTQMIILPVIHPEITEVTADEFTKLHEDSKRGDNAFGSSNEKHDDKK